MNQRHRAWYRARRTMKSSRKSGRLIHTTRQIFLHFRHPVASCHIHRSGHVYQLRMYPTAHKEVAYIERPLQHQLTPILPTYVAEAERLDLRRQDQPDQDDRPDVLLVRNMQRENVRASSVIIIIPYATDLLGQKTPSSSRIAHSGSSNHQLYIILYSPPRGQ